jgi:hypothetical protein
MSIRLKRVMSHETGMFVLNCNLSSFSKLRNRTLLDGNVCVENRETSMVCLYVCVSLCVSVCLYDLPSDFTMARLDDPQG